jgi:hypothetical protein
MCNFFTNWSTCATARFRRETDEKCALLGYCAASSGNFLPTFRDYLPVPSSGFKNLKGWDLHVVPKHSYQITTARWVITQQGAILNDKVYLPPTCRSSLWVYEKKFGSIFHFSKVWCTFCRYSSIRWSQFSSDDSKLWTCLLCRFTQILYHPSS